MVMSVSFIRIFLFILFFVPCLALAADVVIEPEVKIVLNQSEVEMGKFILARIEYSGDNVPPLSNIQQWYDDFFVDRRDEGAEKFAGGRIQYTETMRLYPRKTGDKILASIALGGAIAQAVKIKVKPAVRGGINGTPQWQPLPEIIWQGQTIEVSIVQHLLNASNQVVAEDAQFPGFYAEQSEQKISSQNNIKSVQLHWLLTAQSSGLVQLESPAIEQRGRGRWRFYLPRVTIKVKPLPSYIPPTVPVGKLSIRTGVVVENDKPLWTIELQNEGQLPDEIYGMRRQLSELTGVSMESVDVLSIQPESSSPLTFNHQYRVSVPDWSWGFTDGPEIVVPYFDVAEGQIKTLSERLPGVWYFSREWRYVLFFVLALLSIIVLMTSSRVISNISAWQRYRYLLQQTKTPHELRRLLLAQGQSCTLDSWSALKHNGSAKQIADQLNSLCYSRSCDISVDKIKQRVINLHTFRYWSRIKKQDL